MHINILHASYFTHSFCCGLALVKSREMWDFYSLKCVLTKFKMHVWRITCTIARDVSNVSMQLLSPRGEPGVRARFWPPFIKLLFWDTLKGNTNVNLRVLIGVNSDGKPPGILGIYRLAAVIVQKVCDGINHRISENHYLLLAKKGEGSAELAAFIMRKTIHLVEAERGFVQEWKKKKKGPANCRE